jgi:hypothetical protein
MLDARYQTENPVQSIYYLIELGVGRANLWSYIHEAEESLRNFPSEFHILWPLAVDEKTTLSDWLFTVKLSGPLP